MSENFVKKSGNESLRNNVAGNFTLEKMKKTIIFTLLSIASTMTLNATPVSASQINPNLQKVSDPIAQNNLKTQLRTERRGDRVFKENPNFPFLLFDSTYQNGQEIKIPPISNIIPNFANPNMKALLKIILNSDGTYDDFEDLNLTYRNVFGISGQNMIIEQRLKVNYDDPDTKMTPNGRSFGKKQTITFRQGDKPGGVRGNVSFNFDKAGCYVQIFYIDEHNIKTLKSIFGEEVAKEFIGKAELDNLRRFFLTPEEQQTLIRKVSELTKY